MKNIISFVAIVTLLIACTKNSNREVTVTGRLMQTCETPAANRNGIIHLSGGGLLNHPSTSLEFTTDENGYFKVTHNRRFSEFSVRTSANHSVLEASISGDEKELGEVYIFHPNTRFLINLKVHNQYTEQDTLLYPDYNSSSGFGWRKVPGPFSNGIIDTVHNSFNSSAMPINFNDTEPPQARFRYYINEPIHANEKITKFPTPHCQEDYQTVTLVID
jgi:hypothetical protein